MKKILSFTTVLFPFILSAAQAQPAAQAKSQSITVRLQSDYTPALQKAADQGNADAEAKVGFGYF